MAKIQVERIDWVEKCTRCGEQLELLVVKLHPTGNATLSTRCPACESEQAIELTRLGSHETLGPR